MNKTVTIIVGIIVVAGIAWYTISPLFINEKVDEAFPNTAVAMPSDAEIAAMSEEEKKEAEMKMLEASAELPDVVLADDMPVAEIEASTNVAVAGPKKIRGGMISGADAFHKGSGEASIYELADGTRVLRLENFSVTNGPDLRVLISAHANPTSKSDLDSTATIELSKLKGNKGNQNYEIPADVALADIKSFIVYCRPFNVVFASASLK